MEIWGLNSVPSPGDKFLVVDSLDKAKSIAGERAENERQKQLQDKEKVLAANFYQATRAKARNCLLY
ncbi:MAG: hypothetical protein U5N86_09635 [Planctomycetota bacterium]|nr:hypothetical protein [Planctomycetota bacterium]